MEPVFYLSLDNYLCLPQTSSGALNQGAGAWVFVQAGCVCACACTRRASCRPQHSPTAIRLKPCCCGAWLSSLLQGLQLTLNPRLHNDCPSHTEVFTHETNVPTHSNAHAHIHTHKYTHTHTIPPFSKVVCVASELTSHHHPGCWQPLLWPPGAWPPSELCLDNQSVRRQAILTPAGLDAATHTHRLHIPGVFGH